MRTFSLLFSSFALFSLVGCGGAVDTQGGAGGASASSSSSAVTVGASASTSSTASSSSSGAGGGGACSGYIDLAEDNGAQKHYTSICANSWGSGKATTPVGYIMQPGSRLNIVGCQSSAAMSPGIQLIAYGADVPGTYALGMTLYTDMAGQAWGIDGDPFKMTVTKLDMVGGAIDGDFTVMVTHGGNAAHNVAGSFHVCRVDDELTP